MEHQIKDQLISCFYKECSERLFTWNYHSHVEKCPCKPLKCLFCHKDTSLSNLKNHIRDECSTQYVEYSHKELSGSYDLWDRFTLQSENSFKLDMASLSHSFYLIYKKYFILFIFSGNNWGIMILSLTQDERAVSVLSGMICSTHNLN